MLQFQVFIIFIEIFIGANAQFHEIVTKFGTIRGTVETNIIDGSKYYAYRGIRYAKKLTEEGKFRDSEPIEPWLGTLNATEYGNPCIAVTPDVRKVTGDLDCLYLNVYVPQNCIGVHPLSSIFYIHGGAFSTGSGDDSIYGPDYLIREGVILVTINYRLGPIGFLNLGTASSPGNVALKDQYRALKFYKEVIAEAVGGDPNEITIYGCSSGAASVSYHTISPMSRGLFKRAIQESGSSLGIWAYYNNLTRLIEITKTVFNLTSNDPEELAQELTGRSARDIVQDFIDYVSTVNMVVGALTFVPSMEKKIEGVEQFLYDSPYNILFDETVHKVPLLIGVNSDDGALFAKDLGDFISNDVAELVKSLPNGISYLFDDLDSAIRQIYENYRGETTDARNDLFLDDLLFFFDAWTTLNLYYEDRTSIYFYYFQFRNTTTKDHGKTELVCLHGDQIKYLFYQHSVKNKYSPGTVEYNLMTEFTKTWTSFVKTGNPTPSGSGALRWKKYNQGKSVMTIDEHFVLRNVTTLEKGFNSRMCYILSCMKQEIQDRFKPLRLC